MGSLGVEVVARKKAMWLYPKVAGAHPSERWGHSACFYNGSVYIFGGCCGGLHFSDVLVLSLESMSWNTLVTTGQGPGPRDSHSAVLVGHRMIVFGGTSGCKKVNDLHILDLRSLEWSKPVCEGIPPSPRESHTTTLVGSNKLVIFGGSGEGVRNYLNDAHVLDLKSLRWTSIEVRGDKPVSRDSHSAVAIGNKLFVYGGDRGDRYQGNVDVLDTETLTWFRLDVSGPCPGGRAGHTSVNFGTKVYVIGGVGDKKYYNDVWVLDIVKCSWTQLDVNGKTPQGRFSHAATSAGSDIIIYGGCGEDERPLSELLVLQLGAEHLSSPRSISTCKIFGNQCNLEKKMLARETENNLVNQRSVFKGHMEDLDLNDSQELAFRTLHPLRSSSDTLHPKRRRTSNSKINDLEAELEEHSLSLSHHSSPCQSDPELSSFSKATDSVTVQPALPFLKQAIPSLSNNQAQNFLKDEVNAKHFSLRTQQERCDHPMLDQRAHIHTGRCQETRPTHHKSVQSLIGADIQGKVEGLFDSGLLMTATVNGRIYRGVLFPPGPSIVSRGTIVGQQHPPGLATQIGAAAAVPPNIEPARTRHKICPGPSQQSFQLMQTCSSSRPNGASRPPSAHRDSKLNSELEGVVLSLRGPGTDHQASM